MRQALSICIVVAASSLPVAAGAAPCTQEKLTVEGRPVTIGYCVSGPLRSTGTAEVIVPVTATYSAPGGSFQRMLELRFMDGEGVSRVLESLDLSALGLSGTLHITLAYSHGLVQLEGALLTPGAITIK
jgi:hypothetical protein